MLKNYILIAFRNLKKYKVYSFINLLGLSIALVPVLLILLNILYELSYDKYNENFERIYRVVRKNSAIMPMPLAAALKADVPEIEYSARMRTFSDIISYKEKRNREQNLLYADPEILNIFSFKFIKGNPFTALSDKYSVLISESMANKYFGDEEPIGKVIKIRDLYQLKITAVFKDVPENSHFSANFILPATILAGGESTSFGIKVDDQSWGLSIFFTYVLLKKETNHETFLSKIHSIIEKYAGENFYSNTEFSAQPLSDIHLFSHFPTELKINGDITKIYLYSCLAFIILIIAVINYINLAAARASRRIKEIGIRKIIGAKKRQLIYQLLSETLLLTFVAFIIAYVLTELALPYFNEFVNRNIQLNIFQNPDYLLFAFGLILFIGLGAGLYPSFVLSSISPLSFFKGNMTLSSNTKFGRVLVTIQFMLSIILIFITTSVNKQMDYIAAKDLGFEKDNIIYFSLFSNQNSLERIEAFKNEVLQYPGIAAASASINLPFSAFNTTTFYPDNETEGKGITVYYNMVDFDYIDLYGLKITRGRKFLRDHPSDENEAAIISESAVKAMGWEEPIGKVIRHTSPDGSENRTVIGVVSDFHMHSLYKEITPYYMVIDKRNKLYHLSVKLNSGNFLPAIDFLKDKIKTFDPDNSFNYFFIDDAILSSYNTEFKTQSIFTAFSGFTIFIACLGLFGLVSFTTEVRKKEFGIRKVMGASSYQIGGKILKEMMVLIIVSSLLAVPIAYYAINKWLSSFAYKVNISPGMFINAILIVYAVAVSAMIIQVYKAAIQNPVNILRSE